MATERPVVLGVLAESAAMLEAAGAGVVIEPGSAVVLESAINPLAGDPEQAKEMGRKGRRFVDAELDRDKLAAQMLDELRLVAVE